MAKYTMNLNDYLKNGYSIPEFSEIDGFKQLFIDEFIDKEIGFETPSLFSIKLANRAKIVMPYYATRIEQLATANGFAKNPVKTRYHKEDVSNVFGEQNDTTTELPYETANATPSVVSNNGSHTDTSGIEYTETESGGTMDESVRFLDSLNGKVQMILMKCLDEFRNLFMKVY